MLAKKISSNLEVSPHNVLGSYNNQLQKWEASNESGANPNAYTNLHNTVISYHMTGPNADAITVSDGDMT